MINSISSQQALDWLSRGEAILIDVREPDEFQNEHIAYAYSLPLGRVENLFASMQVPENRKVIFQCQKGWRGGEACMIIDRGNARGRAIYNLEGGIVAWKDAGLPVVATMPGLPIFRQVQMVVGLIVAALVFAGFMGLTLAFALAGLLGAMLFMAGLTGWCGMAMLLKRMPWNRQA